MSSHPRVPRIYEDYLEAGFDTYHAFLGVIPHLIDVARFAAKKEAISYRNCIVGGAGLAVDFDSTRVATFSGGNNKPARGYPKECAETSVLHQARRDGFDHMVGLVIAATTDPEIIKSVQGRATPTLHPCQECRHELSTSSLITNDTLIVTVGLDQDVMQVHSSDELNMIYALDEVEEYSAGGPVQPFSASQWADKQNMYDMLISRSDNLMDPPALAKFVLSTVVSRAN